MAAGAPAGALLQAGVVVPRGVIVADIDLAGIGDGGSHQVAAHAEIGVAGDKHLGVDRAVRLAAGDTALLHRVVREDERTLLLGVALGAGVVLGLEVGPRAADGIAGMDIVAIHAG